ncbi:MAG: FCD domain-containing protein [Gammaproteobacteria bacterium]|nr:FCD domain-containing protein [Gammaproteobacteria bacterium]MCP5199626.1 FCD domain-containing protein [Gammaproteobacteria bacterium]
MGRVSGRTLSEAAYERLRSDIIAGRLPPEAKLRIEELRDIYDTGASPLREALNRLAGEGFVTAAGQRGFNVAPLSLAELDDITRLRILLECEAASDAIRQGDDAWEGNLVAAWHHLHKLDGRDAAALREWEVRNQAFHEALIAACESTLLLRVRRTLYEQHKRYRLISILEHDAQRDVDAEHRAIFEAALARDVAAARRAIEVHVQRTADATRAAFARYATAAGEA